MEGKEIKASQSIIEKRSALNLMKFLEQGEVKDLSVEMKKEMILIQNSLTPDSVQRAPKIFQFKDKELAVKICCAILTIFNETNSFKERMSGVAIYKTSVQFIDKYTHESISDMMLCLRMLETGDMGELYYDVFDGRTFFEYFNKYLDRKYKDWESSQRQQTDNVKSFGGHRNSEVAAYSTERQRTQEAERVKNIIDAKGFWSSVPKPDSNE